VGVKTDIKNSTYMRPSTYGHASFDGQSPEDQSIIKIEVNTKKDKFLKEENYYKINLSMYKIRGKTKMDIDTTSIEN
jgi:hypothetical protein